MIYFVPSGGSTGNETLQNDCNTNSRWMNMLTAMNTPDRFSIWESQNTIHSFKKKDISILKFSFQTESDSDLVLSQNMHVNKTFWCARTLK